MNKNHIFAYVFLYCFMFIINSFGNSFDNLKIDSKRFKARGDSLIFDGSVYVNRNKDFLKANRATLKFYTKKDGTKAIKRYTAKGNVYLKVKEHNNTLIVKGDEVVYSPLIKKYVIYGNGYIKDTKHNREISGDKIFIDLLQGTTQVQGSGEAPVEFIIRANEQ